MAVAILQCMEPSECFPTKILKLEEGIPQVLGRSLDVDRISSLNGLFHSSFPGLCFQHACLLYCNKKFFIEDTSLSGTYLNGLRITKNCLCNIISGDVIQLGGESFHITGNFQLLTFSVKLFPTEDADFIDLLLNKNIYNEPLQLYKEVPLIECSLSFIHKSIINRFEALKILDSLGNIYFLNDNLTNRILQCFREKYIYDMIKLVRGSSCSYEEEYTLQKMDHISHFILSIACCRNYVSKKWFIDQESKLLLLRWKFLSKHEKVEIISEHFSYFKEVTGNEIISLAKESNGIIDTSLKYYKIFFTDISDLIAERITYVKKGFCYVKLDDFIYAIKHDFTKCIKINLENIKKNLHRIWNDERIVSIISCIEKEIQIERFTFSRRRTNSSAILRNIDEFAEQSFPLCMNVLHFHLKSINHLRNSGRFQYGLFLKGIGLTLQDSLTFWRYYFTKKMTVNEFIKHYNYHIFHLYGAIGKNADYPPQSCKKILQAVPSFAEYHGCPFKVLDEENMNCLLRRNNVPSEDMKSILDIMKNDMPQFACSKYFEIKHGSPLSETVFHPNIYYEESRKLFTSPINSQLKENTNLRNNTRTGSLTSKRGGNSCCNNSLYDW